MSISRDNYYDPDEALHELMVQETIINVAVDVQMLLRILVDKDIITREEVNQYREEVRNSPKYRPVIEDIQRMKEGFQKAKTNPEKYFKAILKAKMNGDIK